jgi:hypothetical protein
MLLDIAGKIFKREHPLRTRSERDLRLTSAGNFSKLWHPDMFKYVSLLRFPIVEGTSTKLKQKPRDNVSRFVASERFGNSLRFSDPNKFIFLRH